jgi:hypothetical protein
MEQLYSLNNLVKPKRNEEILQKFFPSATNKCLESSANGGKPEATQETDENKNGGEKSPKKRINHFSCELQIASKQFWKVEMSSFPMMYNLFAVLFDRV